MKSDQKFNSGITVGIIIKYLNDNYMKFTGSNKQADCYPSNMNPPFKGQKDIDVKGVKICCNLPKIFPVAKSESQ